MTRHIYIFGSMLFTLLAFSSPHSLNTNAQSNLYVKEVYLIDTPAIIKDSTKLKFEQSLKDWDNKIDEVQKESTESLQHVKKVGKQTRLIEKLIEEDTAIVNTDSLVKEVKILYQDTVKKESRLTKFLKKLKIKL